MANEEKKAVYKTVRNVALPFKENVHLKCHLKDGINMFICFTEFAPFSTSGLYYFRKRHQQVNDNCYFKSRKNEELE